MKRSFKDILTAGDSFAVTWELVPGRGAWEVSQDKVIKNAERAACGNIVNAISLTDNPGGNIGIRPDVIAQEIAGLGLETIIHITCKDKNRYQLESELYALERSKLTNLLILTGDFNIDGNSGRPKPVFDLDSTQLLELVSELNKGLEIKTLKGSKNLKKCNFFPGAAFSPFKATEAEVMMQYSKLDKKIKNGARFIITQIGYDVRKYHELILYNQQMNRSIPIIGNLYILSFPAGKAMNRNRVPGCVVTDKLLAELEQEYQASDKGKQAGLERGAKLYAILKGLGYKGVHIGGNNLDYEQVEYVVTRGEELSANWRDYIREFDYPQDNGFYIYNKDEKSGLNALKLSDKTPNGKIDKAFNYKISRCFHKMFFVPDEKLFRTMQRVFCAVKDSKLENGFHALEHMAKSMLYNCQDCGDCALTDIAYVCPMGDCPKNQRNGPCEGSYQGWCEVYPGKKKCIWERAYNRSKEYGEEKELNSYQVKPYDWKLRHTSSWLNFYLGCDHSAARLGIHQRKSNKNKLEEKHS